MKYRVFIITEAKDDIFDIYQYVLRADGRDRANHVLEKLQEACQSLGEMPHRGHVSPEIERIGMRDYLEIHFKPYRIVYRIVGTRVFIHCVLDGRRAVQEVLERRLLR